MNSVGIDVSKGKSMVAVMRPFGEIAVTPYEVCHTDSDLSEHIKLLSSLEGETRIVMESTGNYHTPIAWALYDAGFYVSVVNNQFTTICDKIQKIEKVYGWNIRQCKLADFCEKSD